MSAAAGNHFSRRAFIWAVLCCVALTATGCLSMNRPNAKALAYVLEAPRPASQPARKGPAGRLVIKVRPFRAGQMLSSLKLTYKQPGATWETDFYHEFFASPEQMLTGIVQDWLRESGVAGQVVPASSSLDADCVIEGNLLELYGDFSNPKAPKAACMIELLAIDQRTLATPRVLFHKTYRRAALIPARDAQALVTGWNKILTAILTEFEVGLAGADWTAPALAERPESVGQ